MRYLRRKSSLFPFVTNLFLPNRAYRGFAVLVSSRKHLRESVLLTG